MKKINSDALSREIEVIRTELTELEGEFPRWNPDNVAGAKRPRAIARRIVLSAQHLEVSVKENTYTPGT